MSQEEYRKAAIDAVKKLSADVESHLFSRQSKKMICSSLQIPHTQMPAHRGNPKDASVEDLKDLFRKIMA